MRKAIASVLIATGATVLFTHAFARGPGGMGGAGMGGSGSYGPSNQSMPTQATTNSNGPWTGTQEKGLDRAQERMSDQGSSNEKAIEKQDRRDNKSKGVRPPH